MGEAFVTTKLNQSNCMIASKRTMSTFFSKIRLPAFYLAISMLVHLISIFALRMFGTYDFSVPVNRPSVVMVDLSKPCDNAIPKTAPEKLMSSGTDTVKKDVTTEKIPEPSRAMDNSTPPVIPEQRQTEQEITDNPVIGEKVSASTVRKSAGADAKSTEDSRQQVLLS